VAFLIAVALIMSMLPPTQVAAAGSDGSDETVKLSLFVPACLHAIAEHPLDALGG